MADNKKVLNEDSMLKLLDSLYEKSLQGIPGVSVSVEQLALDYLNKNTVVEQAARSMLNNQIAKCTTSGVITGIGGFLTLPVSIPANLASTIYMQLRMIAAAAYMSGRDIYDDITKASVYACLSGIPAGSLRHPASEDDIDEVRRLSASRLVSKLGEKGFLNLVKLVPVFGAGINGGVDFFQSRTIADRAFRMFFESTYAYDEEPSLKEKGRQVYEDAKTIFKDADIEGLGRNAAQKASAVKDWIKDVVSNRGSYEYDEEYVYISATGKSYHTDVSHAGKDPIKIRRSDAEANGYAPCRRCVK